MFKITANYNGEELKIRDGKELLVRMPSQNMKNNMRLFVGIKPDAKKVEWKTTNRSFGAKTAHSIMIATDGLDVTYLKTLILRPDETPLAEFNYQYLIQKFPAKPIKPKVPRKNIVCTEERFRTKFEKKTLPSYIKRWLVKKENSKLEKEYNLREERYDIKLAKYEKRMEQFVKDSSLFGEDYLRFYRWIDSEIAKHEESNKRNELAIFNSTISSLIRASNKRKLSMQGLEKAISFNSGNDYYISKDIYHHHIIDILNWIRFADNKAISEICINRKLKYNSQTTSYSYRKYNYVLYSNQIWQNRFAQDLVKNDARFGAIVADFKIKILEKKAELGMLTTNNVAAIYSTSIPAVGYYNCDRFSNTPTDSLITIKVNTKPNASVYYYIKGLNSMIVANQEKEGKYFAKIPLGTELSVLVLELKEGNPMFQKIDQKVTSQKTITAETKPVKLATIYKELAGL